MATVYEAAIESGAGFRRRVAVKQVRADLVADDSVRRMFFDEARTAGFLHHGNIVQVIDYGLLDEGPILVMEFIDGINADEAVHRGGLGNTPVPGGVALHIITEVAHALSYAHGCLHPSGAPLDIVHRDISPQNILLSWEGDVKLADFGIALSTVRFEKSATGVIKGKVRYMPPEQLSGRSVGPAADIYALGATLHAILTGEPPEVDLERSIRQKQGAVHFNPVIEREIKDLIVKCMHIDPERRPTADSLARISGQLSLARLPREGRGALRSWLGEIRDVSTPKPNEPMSDEPGQASLDDIMGECLSPTWIGGSMDAGLADTLINSAPPVQVAEAQTATSRSGSAPRDSSSRSGTETENETEPAIVVNMLESKINGLDDTLHEDKTSTKNVKRSAKGTGHDDSSSRRSGWYFWAIVITALVGLVTAATIVAVKLGSSRYEGEDATSESPEAVAPQE